MDQTERQQMVDRLQKVAVEMDAIVRQIGPAWIRLAHLRKEARMISDLLRKDDDARPGD